MIKDLRTWFLGSALPLWSGSGFDCSIGRFEEWLPLPARDGRAANFRVMVQARQISTFARAHVDGSFSVGSKLDAAFYYFVKNFSRVDAGLGWSFSIDSAGNVSDNRIDLYAHSFVLYALAWMFRVDGSPSHLKLADQTLDFVESAFASGGPGFLSVAGKDSGYREQNPHMHLLEAALVLYEFSGRERYAEFADRICDLFSNYLFSRKYGVLLEKFDGSWMPVCESGRNSVEPGHQFEWIWLLRQCTMRLNRDFIDEIDRMYDFLLLYGIDRDRGCVLDEVKEDGTPVSRATRVWPQAEALRALSTENQFRSIDVVFLNSLHNFLSAAHCSPVLGGGWFDRLDPSGLPLNENMPASTLYHLANGVFDFSIKCSN